MRQLTPDEAKALRHIVSNGDDRALKAKEWKPVKVELHHLGLLRRRIGDWDWIPTDVAISYNRGHQTCS